MLSYRLLEDAGEAVIRLIAETEQVLINDMARRIARLGEVTASTNWQAHRLELLGTSRDRIMEDLARLLNVSDKRLIEMFDEAATRAIAHDNNMYKAAGYSPVPIAENPQLQQIILAGKAKTKGSYVNLSLTTANTASRQFENALDLAYQSMMSGGFTYQQAIKQGVQSLTRNGIASIRYPSGHVDYMDVAFRRATLTGINQTCSEIQLENMRQLGTDLVETTAHHGARPEHALWQGMVFSVSGTDDKYGNFYTETGYGTGAGLGGWNCRHSFFPFFDGLSDPAYTADRLRSLNSKMVDYDGERMNLYDATQRQRQIERNIRRWKREASAMEAAGLDSRYARDKVRAWQAKQRDFIDQTGLRRDYFRERGGKQLTNSAKGATMTKSSLPLEKPVLRDLISTERALTKVSGYEECYILDKKGNVLHHEIGNKDNVTPPPSLVKDNILTHNHPSGGCALSGGDIKTIIKDNGYEIRVVTADGRYTSLTRGAKGWNNAIYDEFEKSKLATARELLSTADLELMKKYGRGNYSGKQVYSRAESLVNDWLRENATKYGAIFKEGSVL